MTKTLGNVHEYTVSELSGAVKKSIEEGFGFVRVRGELGRVTRAASGHMYLDLKDEKAVISSVMWKGMAARLSINPEQGMEVVASGRMTTFPGQSRYQLVIDSLEPAGVGALMALFEERKKKLAAEGLFAPERKQKLPYLPEVIGVVTSPSGAVIRDILHRLRDRFPRHVIVWPTLVQGRGAEGKIAAAIEGFNALAPDGDIPRPDVLIVARGGGSLEDLWCFNEEVVARAAAASTIPLISAVGHETDTTLIDYVADLRAPTPTAAAEHAVPVRSELLAEIINKERRLVSSVARSFEARRDKLLSAARGLGRPEDVLGVNQQKLDNYSTRLNAALRARLDQARSKLAKTQLNKAVVVAGFLQHRNDVDRRWTKMKTLFERSHTARETRLSTAGRILESVSFEGVLKRGFALVRDTNGALIRQAANVVAGSQGSVRFADGSREVVFGDGAGDGGGGDGGGAKTSTSIGTGPARKPATKKAPARPSKPRQQRLFD